MKQYIDLVQDVQGNALVGVTVLVQNYIGAGNASIYSDNGLTPIANSTVTSGADGSFSFFAADGDYNLVFSKNSTVYKTQSPVSIFDGTPQITYADSGTANAYAISNSTLEKALRTGLRASFNAAHSSTGAATFQYNGLAAKPLVISPASSLPVGAVLAGGIYAVEYDGNNWQLRSASSSVAPYYALTTAELTANVTPVTYIYPEGDIRRYGATTGATDNSTYINDALAVSAAGGNAAFIPGGTWTVTASPTATGNCSMYGVGASISKLLVSGCHGLTLIANSGYGNALAPNSFYRDFSLVGANAAASTYSGVYSALTSGQAAGIRFQNLGVVSFLNAFTIQGLRQCVIDSCFVYNVCNGFQFPGSGAATTNIEITSNHLIRGGSMANGGGFSYASGVSMSSGGSPPQSIQFAHNYWYDFDHGLDIALGEEIQFEHCDISNCLLIGVNVTSTIDGLWVRDSWIETNAATLTYGIKVASITPTATTKLNFTGNYINCDIPYAGSTGINIGNSNAGAIVEENMVNFFDVGIALGASAALICRHNTINVVTSVYSATSLALTLNSLAADNEIGPNYLVPASSGSSSYSAASMANSSANIGVAAGTILPAGTPVQFDTAVNGFYTNVTYYSLGISANTLQVASTVGGSALSATGNTALNVFAAPLPITYSAGTAPGLRLWARGSFIGTLTGFSAALTGPVDWTSDGQIVTVNGRASATLTGTSNSTAMTMTGLPAAIWSITAQLFPVFVENNSAGFTYGMAGTNASGTINFYTTPAAGAFTASGTKGINTGNAMSYQLT